jgi:hypothetical protein
MAQFYKGLRPNIKDAMAIQGFPADWNTLIHQATRLNNNFRRRAQETKGVAPKWKHIPASKKQERHSDEID